jgi:hypothetical protein
MVDKVHRITTAAYLLVRFILIHSYEADRHFNADVFMTTTFFPECLYSLQTQCRAAARADDTIRNRNLINGYLANFRQMYNYQPITIDGIQSNWEAYIGRQMHKAYINNTQFKTGQHFRSALNCFFGV